MRASPPPTSCPYVYATFIWFIYKHDLDFEDCLSLAHMEQQNLTHLYSYDRGFDAIAGVTRLEPSAAEANVVESSHHKAD